jgi:hypothetical protein
VGQARRLQILRSEWRCSGQGWTNGNGSRDGGRGVLAQLSFMRRGAEWSEELRQCFCLRRVKREDKAKEGVGEGLAAG